jgi:flavin reductase (DIM6/NTAB) family NADH-FMN oxidoreductase RutF
MSAYLDIDPAEAGEQEIYRFLTGAVVPRPIGWASTLSAAGVANLAPFSFFTVACVKPPMISLTIGRRADGEEKDTLKNIRAHGEFCFNIVTRPVWEKMVTTGSGYAEDISEFREAGLTPLPSIRVKAPRVAEVPIHFECRLHQAIELGQSRHTMVIGEVVLIHVDPACMTGKYVDMRKLDPVGRLNGYAYTALGEILQRKYEDRR